jgi:hypothetical protein
MIKMENVPLRQALDLILKTAGLNYMIREEALVVTAPRGGKLDIEVYPVADLVGTDHAKRGARLVEIISRMIEPQSWEQQGRTAAAIEYYPKTKTLVVNQSSEVHEQIEQLLSALREFKGEQGAGMGVRTPSAEAPRPVVKRTGEGKQGTNRSARVGSIFVVGNEKTPQSVILDQVPIAAGQILVASDLRRAERNLARLNLFVVDPQKGIHPTVTVLDPEGDSGFRDILIQVHEK